MAKVRPSNTSALFTYLAQQEGRKPRPKQYSCADPLKNLSGQLRFTGREKCTLLVDHFEQRFADPSLCGVDTREGEGRRGETLGDGAQLSILSGSRGKNKNLMRNRARTVYNKPVCGPFEDFTETEIRKAVDSVAPHRAPGPDGVASELLRNLPCLVSPLTQLFNVILRTGNFPQSG